MPVCCAAQQHTAGEASTSGRDSTGSSAGKQTGRQLLQQQGRAKKQRLDDYCLALHPEHSKNLIQSWIVQGKVLVNDRWGQTRCWQSPLIHACSAACRLDASSGSTRLPAHAWRAGQRAQHLSAWHALKQPRMPCVRAQHCRVVTKAGTPVPKDATVRINAEQPKYVCRAGHKLEAALEHFGVDVTGLTALDAGLSTGGFTDCLLQRGIARVRRLRAG
jgi:hypothetical protein